jgi:cell division control protein 6
MFKNTDDKGGVFRDRSQLTSEEVEPIGREEEIERIRDALAPLNHRNPCENLLIHGPAGTGKTTCVKHVFNQLENETRVKTVWINCWQYNTRSSLLTELLIQLGYPAPRKGKPVDELLSKTREWLDKNRCIAITLDEFDQMNEKTEIAYDLQLLNAKADNQIGVVMISNQPPAELNLDPRSQSRLNHQTLEFQPYTKDELVTILKERAEKAFHPGKVTDTALERIAEFNADKEGDCRKALTQLRRLGRGVKEKRQDKITEAIVESTSVTEDKK